MGYKSLDGSEDYLVSDHEYSIVSEELIVFQKEWMKGRSLKSIIKLVKLLTPPKHVKQNFNKEVGCYWCSWRWR